MSDLPQCHNCQKKFPPHVRNQHFCDKKCQDEYWEEAHERARKRGSISSRPRSIKEIQQKLLGFADEAREREKKRVASSLEEKRDIVEEAKEIFGIQ